MLAGRLLTKEESKITRCLVTGVAGFIGSHLAERLLAEGYEVAGIDCLTDYYSSEAKRDNLGRILSNPRFRWVQEDLNEADLSSVLQGIDWVFHLAGQPGVRGSWGTGFGPYVHNNIDATQRLLETVRTSCVKKFVYASSSSVYGRIAPPMTEDSPTRPYSPYGVTKLTAEHLCLLYARNFSLPITAVRYFTVFGPRQRPDMAFSRFLRALSEGQEVRIFGDGKQTRDFTYVDDAVEGTLLAARNGVPGEVYNLGGGCTATLIEAIRTMERATGQTGRLVYTAAQDGDVVDTLADTTKARVELGFRPAVDLENGIKLQARWEEQRRRKPTALPASASPTLAHPRRPVVMHKSKPQASQGPRVLLYSHDTYGLGHLRRNLAIAEHILLRCNPPFSAMLLTGSPVVSSWPMPTGLKVQPLPPVVKVSAEEYESRDSFKSFEAVKARREALILESIKRYRPDVFLVDHAPAGMKGELLRALAFIRKEMPATRCVLGLRDILDSAEVVRDLWREQDIYHLLEKSYDHVLVYGSRQLFDVVREYEFPKAVAAKTCYCGYITRNRSDIQASGLRQAVSRSGRPVILVTAGGGGDGYALMDGYLRALNEIVHGTAQSILVLGPLMGIEERQALEQAAAQQPDVQIIPYTTELAALIGSADLVVSMCGYNTTAEILAAKKPAILVPRAAPRAEQRLRATLLSNLGLVWVVQPEKNWVARLAELIQAALAGARPPQDKWNAVDLGGVHRVGDALGKLLRTNTRNDEELVPCAVSAIGTAVGVRK